MGSALIRLADSEMEVDMSRFLFGDGEWVVVVTGEDLFG